MFLKDITYKLFCMQYLIKNKHKHLVLWVSSFILLKEVLQ